MIFASYLCKVTIFSVNIGIFRKSVMRFEKWLTRYDADIECLNRGILVGYINKGGTLLSEPP